MILVKKAYRVWVPNMIGEYPIFNVKDVEVTYADSRAQAKGKFCLSDYKNEIGEDYKYTDIRVVRAKEQDKFDIGGGIIQTRARIEWNRKEEERKQTAINKLNELPENEMYYVQDARNYVGNAMVFWGLKSSGYVCEISQAQKYTKQEILDNFVERSEHNVIWPASHIEKATKVIIDAQRVDYAMSF